MEDDKGMGMEDECVVCIQNLSEMLVFIFIRADISVCVVVVMVAEVVFLGEHSLLVIRIECFGVSFRLVGGGIFDFGGDFVPVVVEMEMEDL